MRIPEALPRWPAAAAALVALALALCALGVPVSPRALIAARDELIDRLVAAAPAAGWLEHLLRQWLRHIVLGPSFYVGLGLILLLERLRPARPQPVLSPSLLQDFVWYLAQTGIFFAVLGWFSGALAVVYREGLGLPTLSLSGWPTFARLGLAVLLSDFLAWLHHLVRHKVHVLWCLHTVHHSQRVMNPFTDARYHVLEYLVAEVIRFAPMFALELSPAEVVGFVWVSAWYTRLCHANIRSRFGPLRWVLVTPQSHRIHHSILPEHADRNFGVLFSIWDRIFGTQHPDDRSYPETGVEDEFPLERGWRSVATFRAFVAQQVYPFRAMVRRGRG